MDHPLGLYSESEKQEWRQLQAMPAYKEALINEVERGTCASMQSCPYAKGGMAAAAGGFDLGSLTPELPGASLINQLLNPWNWLNMASMLMSTVNLFLYLGRASQRLVAPTSASRYRTYPSPRPHSRPRPRGTSGPANKPPSTSTLRATLGPASAASPNSATAAGVSHLWISSPPLTMQFLPE